MERFYRLFTMMYKKLQILGIIIYALLLLLSCDKEVIVERNATLHGSIENIHHETHNYGFKITLENISDPSLKYVAISDRNGAFVFNDIIAGAYSIDAVKDGYGIKWVWMIDDGEVNHRDRLVELKAGQIKELTITMSEYYNSSNSQFKLDLTDVSGAPIENSVFIPKYSTTVAFRLYNGTDKEQIWSVDFTDSCFVSGFLNYQYYFERIFSSFSQTSGRLKPGDTVVLVGTINQEIFKIIDNRNWLSKICFVSIDNDGIGSRDVSLSIEF